MVNDVGSEMTKNRTGDASKSPVILVDGSSYLFRAFHALPPLSTPDGQPTGAIKGVVSMLRKLIESYRPVYMVVVFDAKGKTFRHDLYAAYKAHRPPMPEELAAQIEPLHELVRAMGIPIVVQPGVEADDVIGTLAQRVTQDDEDVLISTGDKDMAQLVNERIALINTMKDERLDAAGVMEKYGVPPNKIIDYLALLGDKSDNVPGLPGVGEKTARALLDYYRNLDHVLSEPEAVVGLGIRGGKGLPKKIAEHADQLKLSRHLVTIDCAVNLTNTMGFETLSQNLDALRLREPDVELLRQYYDKLAFRAWRDELDQGAVPSSETPEVDYEVVTTARQLDAWITRLNGVDAFAMDTETTGLDYMSVDLVGLSFAVATGQACYIPLAHKGAAEIPQLDLVETLARLRPILENPERGKIGQNIKFDMSILARYDIDLAGVRADTMLESYVWQSTGTRHDMDSLAAKYLDIKTVKFEDIAGKGAKQITFDYVPLDQAAYYAAEDADITFRLHDVLRPKLSREAELNAVFECIEMPLVRVLSTMERAGALLDAEALRAQSGVLFDRLNVLRAQIHDIAGEEFNIDSTKQLGEVLFEKLKLPVIKKTPKGAPSTAEPVLQELALDYPLPKQILEYRSLAKLKSTYTDKLPVLINPTTGRVHTSYHQAVTATGRLSSSDPNLQNIPIRTEAGRQIRSAFIAPENHVLVACDYSQIELRIMAHLSEDAGLLDAFTRGEDIHRATAAEVFGVTPAAVTDDQRRDAKAINFGLIYGMSAYGLARQLGIGRSVAQDYIDTYFARYPGVKRYMDSARSDAHEHGFVRTLSGRRLYLADINARNKMLQQAAERAAINAPMQGTAADIIKLAMIDVQAWLQQEKMGSRMILQVHDELVLEVPIAELDTVLAVVPERMSNVMSLTVPLLVDAGHGRHWAEAH
ncbi:MAG: DNA polymerase I [Gammaproteobacteria bacterium]